jgi:Tfp pilus assembly protein PilN
MDCDFIPYTYRERSSQRGAMKLRASLVGAMVALMVLWMTAHNRELATAEAMLTDARQQLTQVDILLTRKGAMEARRERLARLERLVSELRSPASPVVIMSDLSRRMPESVILTDLSIESASVRRFVHRPPSDKKGTPVTGATEVEAAPLADGTRLVVRGLALDTSDAIRFSASLEASPLFADVQMTLRGSGEWGGRQGEAFELSCALPRHVRSAS